MDWYMLLVVLALGLCVGSFLNVVIYRLPLGKSIVFPSSACPACNYMLSARDLVPVLSWLLLRGACRKCHNKISIRYPGVELLTGILFVLSYLFEPQLAGFVFAAAFTAILIVITFIDYDLQIIPDELLLLLGLFAIAANIYSSFLVPLTGGQPIVAGLPFIGWWQLLLGAVTGFAVMLAVFLLSRGGMGGGDVKFAAVLGMWLGWKIVLFALLLAFIIGGLVGIILLVTGVKERKDPIPFGPFMACAAYAFILFSKDILALYDRLVL